MSMVLTSDDLETIAGKVANLASVEGIDVREIKVRGHVVFLRRDGDGYKVVGITNKDTKHPGGGILRGGEIHINP